MTRHTGKTPSPFELAKQILRTHTSSEIDEIVDFPIRSEGNNKFQINRFYGEAFKTALDALTFDGKCALTLYAAADNPRLIPTDELERDSGPDFTFPLGRIVWNASPGEQVERINKKGGHARDWSVKNTRLRGGKSRNRDTRMEFLEYLRMKVGERISEESAKSAVKEVSDKLSIADALHRPSTTNTQSLEVMPKASNYKRRK